MVNSARWALECKSLLRAEAARFPFRPAWWLPGANLQTILPFYLSRTTRPPTLIEDLPTPDDDFVRLHHLVETRDTGAAGRAPLVLLLHGLEGSGMSPYITRMLAECAARGWGACALEFRGCGPTPNRARRLYHSGETSDLDLVAETLALRYPQRPLAVVGYSLGGNVLLKWLGERAAAASPVSPADRQHAAVDLAHAPVAPGCIPISAAVSISAPYDLAPSAAALDRAFGGSYTRHFLRTLIPKAAAKERQYPGCIDIERVRRVRSIVEFDEHATAALHGFAGAADYYARSSCGPFLPHVRTPTLLISAADDPLIPGATLPRAIVDASPWLIPLFTTRGGHVGFVEGAAPWRMRHWAEAQALRFLESVLAQFTTA